MRASHRSIGAIVTLGMLALAGGFAIQRMWPGRGARTVENVARESQPLAVTRPNSAASATTSLPLRDTTANPLRRKSPALAVNAVCARQDGSSARNAAGKEEATVWRDGRSLTANDYTRYMSERPRGRDGEVGGALLSKVAGDRDGTTLGRMSTRMSLGEFVSGYEQASADGSQVKRTWVVRKSGTKYPLIRQETVYRRDGQGCEEPVHDQELVADHVLVRLREEHPDDEALSAFKRAVVDMGAECRGLLKSSGLALVAFDGTEPGRMEKVLAALTDCDRVAYACPDSVARLTGLPNDPYVSGQWGMRNAGGYVSKANDAQISVRLDGTSTVYGDGYAAYVAYTPIRNVTAAMVECGGGGAGEFPASANGKVALTLDSRLTLAQQVSNAVVAGAVGVVAVYTAPPAVPVWSVQRPGVWVPSVVIGYLTSSNVQELRSQIAAGRTVSILPSSSAAVGFDIGASDAWDTASGSTSTVVVVIDTGVDYTHPDIRNNIWVNPGETGLDVNGKDKRTNGIDDDDNGYVDDVHGYDVANDDGDPMDDIFHGTHCAGIIAAEGNNGVGIAGVCWKARIMAVKVFFVYKDYMGNISSGAYDSDLAEAFYYAMRMKNRYPAIKLTSNSWGGDGSEAIREAMWKTREVGILNVVSAGNDGKNIDNGGVYPAAYDFDNILTVAASDSAGGLAKFSNYGTNRVHLGAPGQGIMSTFPAVDTESMSLYRTYGYDMFPGYGTIDGTSMACPQVAGAAALYWSVRPGASVVEVRGSIMGSVAPIRRASDLGKTSTDGNLSIRNMLAGIPVSVLSMRVDDDNVGGTVGNGDGILNPGETVDLWVTLRNNRIGSLTGVQATLMPLGMSAMWATVTRGTAGYGNLTAGGGEGVADTAYRISISSGAPVPKVLEFRLDVTANEGNWSDTIRLTLTKTMRLCGVVRLDSAPLSGATVTYRGTATDTGWRDGVLTSGTNGVYEVFLPAGKYVVQAVKGDYIPTAEIECWLEGAGSEIRRDLDFTTTVVDGYVTDAMTGLGVSGFRIGYTGLFAGETLTTTDGSYRIERVCGKSGALTLWTDDLEYAPVEKNIAVPPGGRLDFALGRPETLLTGVEPIAVTLRPGESVVRKVTIRNVGFMPLEWRITPQVFSAAGVGTTTPGTVVQEIQEPYVNGLIGGTMAPKDYAFDGRDLWFAWGENSYYFVGAVDAYAGGAFTRSMPVGGFSSYVVWDGYRIGSGWTDSFEWGDMLRSAKTASVLYPWPYDDCTLGPSAYGDGVLWCIVLEKPVEGGPGSATTISRVLWKLDPKTLRRVGTLELPKNKFTYNGVEKGPQGIAYFNGALWVTVDIGNDMIEMPYTRSMDRLSKIYKVNPETGAVLREIPVSLWVYNSSGSSYPYGPGEIVTDDRAQAWVGPSSGSAYGGAFKIRRIELGEQSWLCANQRYGLLNRGMSTDVEMKIESDKAGPGTHHGLVRIASDDFNDAFTDIPVTVTVAAGQPPSIRILEPTDGTVMLPGMVNTIRAEATSTNSPITQVECLVGGLSLGVKIVAPYQWSWMPTNEGLQHILVKAINGNGDMSMAEVKVSVTPSNRAPIAVADYTSTGSNQYYMIDVLANDRDPEWDKLTLKSVTQPLHGQTSIDEIRLLVSGWQSVNLRGIVYIPSGNYLGKDTFQYTVADSHGATSTGTVTVGVYEPRRGNVGGAYQRLHLKFDEATGTQALDSSGLENHATLMNGTQRVTGRTGGGVQFDGVNDFVSIGDPESLRIRGCITMMAWVKMDAGDTNSMRTILAKGPSANPAGEIVFRVNNAVPQAGSWDGLHTYGAMNWGSIASIGDKMGNWVHLVGQYDGGDNWFLYVNGHLWGSYDGRKGAVNVASGWSVGARESAMDRFFKGVMDDVRIYAGSMPEISIGSLFDDSKNMAPFASRMWVLTTEGKSTWIDSYGVIDYDLDPVTVTYVSQPGHGTVYAVGDWVRYTPNPGFVGTDDFGYKISDGRGGEVSRQITVIVESGNPPVADAGPDQRVTDADGDGWATVTLDGSGSAGGQGGLVSYRWSRRNDSLAFGNTANVSLPVGLNIVTLTVTDGRGLTSSDTAVVTVTGSSAIPNQPPVVTIVNPVGGTTYTEGSAIAISANATDMDGTITKVEFFAGSSLLGTDNNSPYVFTCSGMPTGHYALVVKATDNGGAVAMSESVNITVVSSNRPPVASFTTIPGSGIAPLVVTFDGGGSSDPDGTITSYVWSFGDGQSGGGKTVNHTYVTPGSYTARLTVTDAGGLTASVTQTITVNTVPNEPPLAQASATPLSGAAPLTVVFSSAGSYDPDGSIVSYAWDFGDGQRSAERNSSHVFASAGVYATVLTVTDDDGATDSVGLTITVVGGNVGPSAVCAPNVTTGGAPLLVQFDASASRDPEGQALTFAWEFGDGQTGSGPTVNHTYSAGGVYQATVIVTDAGGAQASAWATISVSGVPGGNRPPTCSVASPTNGATFIAPATIAIQVNASDSDGTVTKVEFFQGATKLGEDTTSPYAYTRSNVVAGSYTLTAKATDNSGAATTSAGVSVTVGPGGTTNRAPVAVNVTVTTAEDTARTMAMSASDADGDALTYTIVTGPAHGSLGAVSGSNVVYTPATNYNGSDSFTYRASDGKTNSNVATVTITVTPVNDVPLCSISAPVNGATFTAPATIAIQANALDVDGTIAKVEFYNGATKLGEATTAPYQYTWTGVAAGSYTLNAKATDNSGAATTSAGVNVTVNSAGDSGSNVTVIATCDNAYELYVNGVLKGTGNIWSQSQQYMAIPLQPGRNVIAVKGTDASGVAAFLAETIVNGVRSGSSTNWKVSLTAPAGWTNALFDDSTWVSASDYGAYGVTPWNKGVAGMPTDTPARWIWSSDANNHDTVYFRYTIELAGGNRAPVAANVSVTTAEDTARTVAMSASDADGDALTYTIVTGPAHGGLGAVSGSNVVYTPAANYNGADSFTYRVNDGKTNSNFATVTITVTPVNDVPIANAQSVTTAEDTTKAIALTGSDVDGDALTFAIVTGPAHGTLSGTAPNGTYTPTANYYGTDSFTFKVNDGKVDSASATVSITVTSVNDAPSVAIASPTNGATLTTPTNITIRATASDIDGTIAKVEFYNGSTNLGQATTSRYQCVWSNVAAGTYTLTARATDNQGAVTTSAGVTITVGAPVNQPPVALAGVDPISGTTLDEYYFWATDSYDPDGVVISYQWTVNSEEVSTQTEFLYNFPTTGVYYVTLTVWDNKGANARDLVQVQVAEPAVNVSVEVPDGMAGEPGLAEGTARIRVKRTGAVSQALTVNVALSGDASNGVDYTTVANTVVIPAGASYRDVTVSPLADSLDETDETVILAVLPGTGYAIDADASAGVVLIKDQTYGAPVVSAEATDAVAKELTQTADKGSIKVSRTGSCHATLSVYCTLGGTAVNGVDYSAVTVPVVLAVGQSSKVLTIAPLADGVVESNETVVLTLTANAAYQIATGKGSATVTIQDATVLTTPVVSVVATDADAQEPAGGVLNYGYIRFARTTRFHETLTVNCTVGGTASNGVDYAKVTVPIIFGVGEGIKDISIRPIADGVAEGTEIAIFTLTAGTGYTVDAGKGSATVSIRE